MGKEEPHKVPISLSGLKTVFYRKDLYFGGINKREKFIVNPYIFLLAKKMLSYEFVGMDDQPSDLQLAHFIYDRHKAQKYKKTKYSDNRSLRDKKAYIIAETVRKYILTPKDFLYSEKMLNLLISEISILKKYSSWSEFVSQYMNTEAALAASKILGDSNYQLSTENKRHILAHVFAELYSLHLQHLQQDRSNNPAIFIQSERWIFKTANTDEIENIIDDEKKRQILSIDILDFIRKYQIKNDYKLSSSQDKKFSFYFVLKNKYNALFGHVILLPLKPDTYERLKSGRQFINFIEASEILPADQIMQTRYIYFHVNDYYWGYAQDLGDMFEESTNLILRLFKSYLKRKIILVTSTTDENKFNLPFGTGFQTIGKRFDCGIQVYEKK